MGGPAHCFLHKADTDVDGVCRTNFITPATEIPRKEDWCVLEMLLPRVRVYSSKNDFEWTKSSLRFHRFSVQRTLKGEGWWADTPTSMLPGISRKRKVRSKVWWFTGFCNSHYVSHFAAFFIDVGTKTSVAESCIGISFFSKKSTCTLLLKRFSVSQWRQVRIGVWGLVCFRA
jgi:hypothetical protein